MTVGIASFTYFPSRRIVNDHCYLLACMRWLRPYAFKPMVSHTKKCFGTFHPQNVFTFPSFSITMGTVTVEMSFSYDETVSVVPPRLLLAGVGKWGTNPLKYMHFDILETKWNTVRVVDKRHNTLFSLFFGCVNHHISVHFRWSIVMCLWKYSTHQYHRHVTQGQLLIMFATCTSYKGVTLGSQYPVIYLIDYKIKFIISKHR